MEPDDPRWRALRDYAIGPPDAALTFADLERFFAMREVRPEQMPLTFSRVPAETRRHASVAGLPKGAAHRTRRADDAH